MHWNFSTVLASDGFIVVNNLFGHNRFKINDFVLKRQTNHLHGQYEVLCDAAENQHYYHLV
jgi:hypothetical protein